MWGIDATAGFTAQDGQVMIFAMVDHYSAYCLGIHAAKRGTRFEALDPVHQAVQEQFGGFSEAVAAGVRLRHDHGFQFMSADFQADLLFLGHEAVRGPRSACAWLTIGLCRCARIPHRASVALRAPSADPELSGLVLDIQILHLANHCPTKSWGWGHFSNGHEIFSPWGPPAEQTI
jgi:hypothetical protein